MLFWYIIKREGIKKRPLPIKEKGDKVGSEIRQLQVMEQVSELNEAISTIERGINELRDRLKSVLRNDSTISEEKSEKSIVPLVSLASDLQDSSSQIISLSSTVTTMLQELEL